MARRTQRPPAIHAYLGDEVVADSFAGGGGASLGIELALGRSPDLAVDHDAEAIAMHAANHPTTRHYRESVWEVDPIEACQGKSCALAWFSPDCKHHSKAKGGKPRDQKIRGLAWVAITWAHRVKPRVIALENVEEFREWGPLHRTGERAGKPIAARKGETFRAFVRKLERLGYVVEHRLLRACDYGAPTTRRRLFLIARCDGRPIVWPAPTHGKGGELLGLKPYRTAADCIDWSIPCPSIFDRDRPLADKTLARIARGTRKFVLQTGRPFVIPVNHGGQGRRDHRVHDVDAPLPTVTGGQRGGHAVVVPTPIKFQGTSEAHLDASAHGMDAPMPTVTAQGTKLAQVAAFLVRYNGTGDAESVDRPVGALTTKPRFGPVTVTIDGEEYVIADIGMRMLEPRELFRAQGFGDDYEIAPVGPSGKRLSKTAQIRICGNSVSPPVAAAIVRANVGDAAARAA